MPATLLDDATRTVLDRLFTAAAQEGPSLLALRDRFSGEIDVSLAATVAEAAAEIYMPVAPEVGRLLYLLTRARGAALVVEFGTSFGISTIHLAAAVRDNGGGRVITTELAATKAAAARANLAEAGLADLVDLRVGDALETLRDLPGPIDLLLLDGWNQLYLPLLRVLEPHLAPGALVVADDVTLFAQETHGYLEYVHDPANGYLGLPVPIDDGLDLAIRL
ncbi:class I SAM-dependent methyltransferase [Frankia sp. AgPm24]|uniref:Class I SAM-dependent methyltransferase n=1 Tax=Frankia umida TaxID=573489 RepID=A0ABT0JZR2_9ACTN|nr:class I SAM-dependent methyltransferase [Frankia sp. AgPm24]MCK9877028.1 class I SAM-dependent methyltransferase [Frankia umida]MCK9921820.1 class I SAM-dependent methyltransferase [Frankia sp. AgPm24]